MRSNRLRVLLFAAAVVLTGRAVSSIAADILIGQVSSQTSPVTAANAKALYAGINVYFDYTNAQGGVDGRQVKLVNKDDELKTDRMVALTNEFIADRNVLALAGYQNTSGITEVSKQDIPGKAGIAMIAPFQGDRSIVGAANFFPFRSGYPDEVTALVKEAVSTQKKQMVVVYQNVTYGPAMMQLIQDMSKKEGLNVVAYVKLDATAPDKLDAIVKDVVAEVLKASPDSIILLGGGRHTFEFLKKFKESPDAGAQLYLMSIVPQVELLKTLGEAKARGIVIAQAVPYPYSATLPLVLEYQRLMKQYAPNEPLSFSSLEGFVVGKITVAALKRAGKNPTREKVLKALNNMGELDLGGVYVNYSPKARNGWGGVDLTVIGANGKLLR
ncbi:MAG TPA: ABC transporter substrate-binding protein [Burkholderiales bacterium]|nr:ABC transporter substrate-binding protein [Burkholderiales bacterium]